MKDYFFSEKYTHREINEFFTGVKSRDRSLGIKC